MNSIKLMCLTLLTVSIHQVSGLEDGSGSGEEDYYSGSGLEETDKKCDPDYYKCGDVCTWKDYFCSCGNVTLKMYSPELK